MKSKSQIAREAWAEKRDEMERDRVYQDVVGGVAGVIHDAVKAHQTTIGAIADRARLAHETVQRLRDGQTTNPQLYTVVRILAACDQLSLLQLSELEHFTRLARAAARAMKKTKPRRKVRGKGRLRLIHGGRAA